MRYKPERPRLPAGLLSRMNCPGASAKLLKELSYLRAHVSPKWKDQPASSEMPSLGHLQLFPALRRLKASVLARWVLPEVF